MEKDGIATHTDDVPHTPLNFKTMFKKEAYTKENLRNHFKKWWWVHFLIFSCGVLIVALPLVYVGYPNIAQGVVNGADIVLARQSFFSPTLNSIGLQLLANVTVHSIFHAHLDEWNGTLYNEGSDVPLFTFPIPAFKSVTGTRIGVTDTVAIQNEAAFENFTTQGFQSTEFNAILKGRGGLKLGALPHIHVNYNKVIKIPGLGGLKDLITTNLSLTPGPMGSNTQGTVIINNPSPLNLTLGDASFDVTLNNGSNIVIGNATIPNLVLAPGNNSYPLSLNSSLNNVLQIVQQNTKYQCGVLPVLVAGTGVTFAGQNIPYWTAAFKAAKIQTVVDISSILSGLLPGLAGKQCTS